MRPAHPPKYYHQRFNRVPTVEECYMDDVVCIFEAHEQYKRDRKVDAKIVEVLRSRWHHCMRYHGFDQAERCEAMRQEFQDTETNWFIKCECLPDRTEANECACLRRGRVHVHELCCRVLQAGAPPDLGTPTGRKGSETSSGTAVTHLLQKP